MGTGFRPIRGKMDDIREFNTASAATFQKWAPVIFDGARNLVEATSTSTNVVGIALSGSTDSFPAGKIQVLIPDSDTVFEAKIETDVAASAISLGQSYAIEKAANNLRVDIDSQATALVQIVGNANASSLSVVEVAFHRNAIAFGSSASSLVY